jgi:hypothetical protein
MVMNPTPQPGAYETRAEEHRQEATAHNHAAFSDEPRKEKSRWWQFWRRATRTREAESYPEHKS